MVPQMLQSSFFIWMGHWVADFLPPRSPNTDWLSLTLHGILACKSSTPLHTKAQSSPAYEWLSWNYLFLVHTVHLIMPIRLITAFFWYLLQTHISIPAEAFFSVIWSDKPLLPAEESPIWSMLTLFLRSIPVTLSLMLPTFSSCCHPSL